MAYTYTEVNVYVYGKVYGADVYFDSGTTYKPFSLLLTRAALSESGYPVLQSGSLWSIAVVRKATKDGVEELAPSDLTGYTFEFSYYDPISLVRKGTLTCAAHADQVTFPGYIVVSVADTDTVYPGTWKFAIDATVGGAVGQYMGGWIEIDPATPS